MRALLVSRSGYSQWKERVQSPDRLRSRAASYVDGIHFYTLHRSDATRLIFSLGIPRGRAAEVWTTQEAF